GEGRPTDEDNRYYRPTYLRLDDRPEVIRLGPGLIAQLDRSQDYYQQRRLFPDERVAKEAGSAEKVERLAAREVGVEVRAAVELFGMKIPLSTRFRLAHVGKEWELSQPGRDRLDPDKRNSLLEAVPDVWAEQFVQTDPAALVASVAAPLVGSE